MADIYVDLYEPVSAQVTADSSSYSADNTTWPTADGGLLDGAHDYTDAEVIASFVPVGGMVRPLPRPLVVEGRGYGILPELEGEAFGVVTITAAGRAALHLTAEANGHLAVAGGSLARLAIVRAVATGDRGEVGNGAATLKALTVGGTGTAVVHGAGAGTIVKFTAAAHGQHDDEDAAIMILLLAA